MLTRIVISLLSVALLTGVGAAPSHARATRPCVSQQEYRSVQVGWRQADVRDRFDMPGREIGWSDYFGDAGTADDRGTVWTYRKCSTWGPGYVGVGYANRVPGHPDRYMRVWGKVPHRPEQLLARFGGRPSPLQPDGGRPCVTRREYRDARWGWRMFRVADHFDTGGVRTGYLSEEDYTDTVWRYRKCSTWGPGGRYLGIIYNNYDFSVDEEAGAHMRLMVRLPDHPARLVDAIFGRNHLYG